MKRKIGHLYAVSDCVERPSRHLRAHRKATSNPHTPIPSVETPETSPASPAAFPLPLTEDNLARLAAETMSQTPSTDGTQRSKARTVNYSDPEYETALRERNVYRSPSEKPDNWEDLDMALGKHRSSPGLGDEEITILHRVTDQAVNEGTITSGVIPDIVKLKDLICGAHSQAIPQAQWRNDYPLQPEQKSYLRIAAPSPDLTVGYKEAGFPFGTALQSMGAMASPVICQPTLLFPCFALEAKGLQDKDESRRQNSHNGAVMVRNLRKLRRNAGMTEEMARADFDGTARVLTVAFSKQIAELNCHWSKTNNMGVVQYHSCLVDIWALGRKRNWEHVVRYIRNAIDWALDTNREWIHHDLNTYQNALDRQPIFIPPTPSSQTTKGSSRKRQKLDDDSPSLPLP